MSEVELWDTAAARTSGSSGQAPRQTCKRCLTILCNIRRRQYLHLILGFLSAKIFLRGGLKIHCLTLSCWWVDLSTWTSPSHNWLYYYWRAHALSKDCKNQLEKLEAAKAVWLAYLSLLSLAGSLLVLLGKFLLTLPGLNWPYVALLVPTGP